MKKRKNFVFSIAMTLNSVNAGELESFCDLAISLDAEPMIALVHNPFGSISFQKKYLCFTDSMISLLVEQIDRSLPRIREKGFHDAVIIWKHTREQLLQHQKGENNLVKFYIKRRIHDLYCMAPEPVKKIAKSIIQSHRNKERKR
jgi:hypothetical protein